MNPTQEQIDALKEKRRIDTENEIRALSNDMCKLIGWSMNWESSDSGKVRRYLLAQFKKDGTYMFGF